MKSASFFILSLGLHASALVYPVSFYAPNQTQVIQVTILPMDQESHDVGARASTGKAASPPASKSLNRTLRTLHPAVESKLVTDPAPQGLAAEAPTKLTDSSVALVSAIANPAETDGPGISASAGTDARHGAGGSGTSGNGMGSSGTVSGLANGKGSAENSPVWIQASYKETPQPVYPESARSEGREGRVLLRVLVDNQGRSKTIDISSSSGNEALDRAAADAIKRWRFHPARYGDKAVESWLRIPIEFRLADAKAW
jgi:protein TonB